MDPYEPLPDIGIDLGGLTSETISALGAVVVVVVGGFFAFLLVRKAMSWARSLAGDYADYLENKDQYNGFRDYYNGGD